MNSYSRQPSVKLEVMRTKFTPTMIMMAIGARTDSLEYLKRPITRDSNHVKEESSIFMTIIRG